MGTLKQSREHSGSLCGSKKPPREEFGGLGVSETADDGELIITGSFDGLLGRLAKVDYWDAWEAGKRISKTAKKQGVEATIRASEVSLLTGLRAEDIEVFCWSLGFIKIVETGEDPFLLAADVFGLLKVFERFVDNGLIIPSR